MEVERETFEMPPETFTGTTRELIRGAYELRYCLLLELDTDKAIAVHTESGLG